MGQARQHPGHSADARRRIEAAREHYERRKERRVRKPQAWDKPEQDSHTVQYE